VRTWPASRCVPYAWAGVADPVRRPRVAPRGTCCTRRRFVVAGAAYSSRPVGMATYWRTWTAVACHRGPTAPPPSTIARPMSIGASVQNRSTPCLRLLKMRAFRSRVRSRSGSTRDATVRAIIAVRNRTSEHARGGKSYPRTPRARRSLGPSLGPLHRPFWVAFGRFERWAAPKYRFGRTFGGNSRQTEPYSKSAAGNGLWVRVPPRA
jgi:hypothetical protein